MLDKKLELGEFYKELRQARKVKQKDVARDGLSVSQLSKFERGRSMLSADKMLIAIEGIHMTFEEFGQALNNYQLNSDTQLRNKIGQLFVSHDVEGLKNILESLEEGEVFSDKLLSIVVKNAMHSIDKTYLFSDTDRDLVVQYLYSIEKWTYFELYLFGNTLPLLSNMDFIFLSNFLIEHSKDYGDLPQNKHYLKQLLLNIIADTIERGLQEHSTIFIKELERQLIPYDLFEVALLKFLKLVIEFVDTDGMNKSSIQAYIEGLKILDNQFIVELLERKFYEYQKLLERCPDDDNIKREE